MNVENDIFKLFFIAVDARFCSLKDLYDAKTLDNKKGPLRTHVLVWPWKPERSTNIIFTKSRLSRDMKDAPFEWEGEEKGFPSP